MMQDNIRTPKFRKGKKPVKVRKPSQPLDGINHRLLREQAKAAAQAAAQAADQAVEVVEVAQVVEVVEVLEADQAVEAVEVVEVVDTAQVVEVVEAAQEDDAAPTREELEAKAKELGIRFDGRTGDKKLGQLIQDRLPAPTGE
jgi:hypothetical protein